MILEITWRYGEDTGIFTEETDLDESLVFYLWTEGNFSCDCNKSIFFGLAKKYPEKCSPIGGDSFHCGEIIEAISIKIDGKEKLTNHNETYTTTDAW